MNRKIKARNPDTNELIDEIEMDTAEEIKEKMEKAKKAYSKWNNIPIEERCNYLRRIRKYIVENIEQITKVIKNDTGKPDTEVIMSDLIATLSIIKYYEDNSKQILKKEKRKTPAEFYKNESYVIHEPLGVVAVISPWNYPFQLSLVPAITAIAGGNTALIKPSEITPITGQKISEIVDEIDLPEGVIQVVQGDAESGKKIIDHKPDKIFFTGSVDTGKKVMKQASEYLIPVELELGGKDPMIIFGDADIERAAKGAVYGSFANSGQLCVSTERIYVEDGIKDEFISKVKQETEKISLGSSVDSDIGPMINEKQKKKVKEHIEEAIENGAKLHTDFEIEGNYIKPLILSNVNHDMKIMTDETFGPVMSITTFKNKDEAINLANNSKYGLNASVWSNNLDKAKNVAKSLETGNCYINDVVKNIGNPYLPFGGRKNSGIGRYHGPEGLKSFTETKSVMVSKNDGSEINWFPYSKDLVGKLYDFIETKHGDIGPIKKIKNLLKLKKEM